MNGNIDPPLVPKEESGKTSGTEKYDPEDPESETEKEQDTAECKANEAAGEPKVVIGDVTTQPDSVEDSPVTEQSKVEEKKTTRSPATRGPRARRGGRRN